MIRQKRSKDHATSPYHVRFLQQRCPREQWPHLHHPSHTPSPHPIAQATLHANYHYNLRLSYRIIPSNLLLYARKRFVLQLRNPLKKRRTCSLRRGEPRRAGTRPRTTSRGCGYVHKRTDSRDYRGTLSRALTLLSALSLSGLRFLPCSASLRRLGGL